MPHTFLCKVFGGAKGNRTPDLLHAMQALSHLSYGPIKHHRGGALGHSVTWQVPHGTEKESYGPVLWRRDWDLNPGCACTHADFRGRCIKPLCHLSVICGSLLARVAGLEPTTFGFGDQRSTN